MNLRLIDAHCHINFSAYKNDTAETVQRAVDQGIGMIAVGSQSTTSQRAVDFAERFDGVWAVIGLHPLHLFEQQIDESEAGGELAHFKSRAEQFDPEFYRALARRSKKVVGIGECGLDYYHVPEGVDWVEFQKKQEQVFRGQIDLALELGVPVMIHSRDAADGSTKVHTEIQKILRDYAVSGRPVRGDVHCFAGSIKDMEEYIALGMHISFTGNLTYKPRRVDIERGETLWDVARAAPLERILVETDAPYLTPAPHRGERNEPAYVQFVVEKLAELKGLEAEDVRQQVLANTKELFGL